MSNKSKSRSPNKQKSCLKKEIKIAVLGGGMGGAMAALMLTKEFPDANIFIFEKNKNICIRN